MDYLGCVPIPYQKVCFCSLVTHWLGIVVHIWDPIIQKPEDQEFQVNLGYIVRHHLRKHRKYFSLVEISFDQVVEREHKYYIEQWNSLQVKIFENNLLKKIPFEHDSE